MTRDEIRKVVLEELGRIAPEADLEGLPPDADLRDTLDIDSFDFVHLVTALDARLGVDVPEVDYRRLGTLNRCLEYLGAKLASSPSPSSLEAAVPSPS